MSGEGDPSQQQPSVPKVPATTSSFINKGGKTFAPKKAIRRRPATALAPKPSKSSVGKDSQPSRAQLAPSPDVEQRPSPQLPTPAPTQDSARRDQDAPQTEDLVTLPATDSTISSAVDPTPVVEPSPTPVSTHTDIIPRSDANIDVAQEQTAPRTTTASLINEEIEPERSPKQRPLGSLKASETIQIDPVVASIGPTPIVQDKVAFVDFIEEVQSEPTHTVPATEQSTGDAALIAGITPGAPTVHLETLAEIEPVVELEISDTGHSSATQVNTKPTGRRRRWTAVNATQENDGGSTATESSRKTAGGRHLSTAMTLHNMDDEGDTEAAADETIPPQPKKSRRKSKVVTLRNIDEENEEIQERAAEIVVPPQSKRGRRRGKPVTLQNVDEEGGEEHGEEAGEDLVQPGPKRLSAKARGKRKAAEASVGEGYDTAQPPAKKKRQPRKRKANGTASAGPVQNDEYSQDDENGQIPEHGEGALQAVRPKTQRRKKQRSESQTECVGEDEQPKRKGRPPRAPTPEGAEDEIIDPENAFMDDLARRNIRVGKLSSREKKMREVNWADVRQRQKEREEAHVNSRALQAELERQILEAEQASREHQGQPGVEIVDGQLQFVPGSNDINHAQDAQLELDKTVTIEEDDFTYRITQRSFMRNNKRFPEEFLLPGQGKQWNFESTEDFYSALEMFGTDFGMMTTLFQGVSRRSIKLKFNREERRNPLRIKMILQNSTTRLKWEDYLKDSGRDEKSFERVDEIKKEMEQERLEMEAEIERAKEAAAEEKRQRRMAGVESDEEGAENQSSKKKGKKGKEKQVTFEQDESVEILEVDENDGWGEE